MVARGKASNRFKRVNPMLAIPIITMCAKGPLKTAILILFVNEVSQELGSNFTVERYRFHAALSASELVLDSDCLGDLCCVQKTGWEQKPEEQQ